MARTQIKICGIRDLETLWCMLDIDPSPRYFGMVFAKGSPRQLTIEQAEEMVTGLSDSGYMQWLEPVFLFCDQPMDYILDVTKAVMHGEGCATIQLHGHEDAEFVASVPEHLQVFKAVPFDPEKIDAWRHPPDNVAALLIDAPTLPGELTGGTGRAFNWHAFANLDRAGLPPIMLAGGLTAENVAEAIRVVRPFAVDVSSGVESSRGVKDPALIRRFCDAVHSTDSD